MLVVVDKFEKLPVEVLHQSLRVPLTDPSLALLPTPSALAVYAVSTAGLRLDYQGKARGAGLRLGHGEDAQTVPRRNLYAIAPVDDVFQGVSAIVAGIVERHGAGRWWSTGGAVVYVGAQGEGARIATIEGVPHVVLAAYYFWAPPTLDERPLQVGDLVRWHPTLESPCGGMHIDGIAERVTDGVDGTRRVTVLRVTAVYRGTSLGERGFALGSLVDVTVAPGKVERLSVRPRPYTPGEKMTDRHPDSVIAQVVEGVIAQNRISESSLQSVDDEPAAQRRGPFDYDVPRYDGILKAPYEQAPRPDGFAQRQVDAAKAALLAPAPPRYPRTNGGRR